MNKYELKEKIAEKVIKIKENKKLLRQNHQELGIHKVASAMEVLDIQLKPSVRAMYLIYGWFRGKTLKQVDTGEIPYSVIFKAKKLLDKEAHEHFDKWLKE